MDIRRLQPAITDDFLYRDIERLGRSGVLFIALGFRKGMKAVYARSLYGNARPISHYLALTQDQLDEVLAEEIRYKRKVPLSRARHALRVAIADADDE